MYNVRASIPRAPGAVKEALAGSGLTQELANNWLIRRGKSHLNLLNSY